jgi:DNA gyrase subunit A
MYDIPEGKRATRGKSIQNYLQLMDGEKVTSVLPMAKELKGGDQLSLAMITKFGVAKKCSAESFKDVRRSGIICIKLDSGDELLNALFVKAGDEIMLTTLEGQSIRFKEDDVREMGRQAGGVIGMKLDKGDHVVSAQRIEKGVKGAKLLIMTENGFGKMTDLKEYKTQGRGGSGIKTVKVTDKTGKLMVARVVTGETEILAISKQSVVIKTTLDSVPTLGRDTQGVRIMKPKDGDSIASLNLL